MPDHQAIRIAQAAQCWLGTPYRHQASFRGAGADCLGLVRGVWREAIGEEPEDLPIYDRHGNVPEKSLALTAALGRNFLVKQGPAQMGDLLLFCVGRRREPIHCAIMVSDRSFIHAVEHRGTIQTHMSKRWQQRLHALYSFPKR